MDPRNWGDAGISESELDPEAQKEALHNWARSREWAEGPQCEESEVASSGESDTITPDPIREAVEAAVERVTQTSKEKRPKESKPKAPKEPRVTFDPVQTMVEKAIKHQPKARERHPTPPAVDAAAQIAKRSYLGHAFKDVRRPRKKRSSRRRKDSSDSSSSSSSSDESSSTSSTTTEESSTEESSSSSETDDSSPVRDRRASKLPQSTTDLPTLEHSTAS